MPKPKTQKKLCLECQSPATFEHHVIPRSLGGTATVPLCSDCHPKAHRQGGSWKVSELTKDALERKRAKQEKTGGTVPFGFELVDGVRLLPKPEEFETVKMMHYFRRQGFTLRKIAQVLTEKGIPTKTGKAGWRPEVVLSILKRTQKDISYGD